MLKGRVTIEGLMCALLVVSASMAFCDYRLIRTKTPDTDSYDEMSVLGRIHALESEVLDLRERLKKVEQ